MFNPVMNGYYASGYEEIAITDAVSTLTPALVSPCAFADVRFYGGTVRVMLTGDDPAPTRGVPFMEFGREVFSPGEARRLRAVREGSDDGLLRITYYMRGD